MPAKTSNVEDEDFMDSDGECHIQEDPKVLLIKEQSFQNAIEQIKSFKNANKLKEALLLGLSDLPSVQISRKIKEEYVGILLELLSSIKSSEFQESISVDQADRLMKLIYKGFTQAEKFSASSLLQWHEKALEIGGLGSIVRVLSDKQVVL